mgnify:FL=1
MNNINFESWANATHSSYGNDPTEYDIEVDLCKRCDMYEKWEDTDVCSDCIDELEEMQQISLCCGDSLHVDTNRCTSCYEWSESEFEEYCIDNNFNPKTYKYEKK